MKSSRIEIIKRSILPSLLTIITLWVPQAVNAQNSGVTPPKKNAMEYLFQNPERWSGSRYNTLRPTTSERLYFNIGGEYGAVWNMVNSNLDHFITNTNANLAVGYNLSPVHKIEVGARYTSLNNRGDHFALNLGYLFDITAYASRLERPSQWQLLAKAAAEMDMLQTTNYSAAVALRAQYNVTPGFGLYLEPKLAMCLAPKVAPHNAVGRSDANTTLTVGASFNVDRMINAYRDHRDYVLENRWWNSSNYSGFSNFANRLYITGAGEIGELIHRQGGVLTDLSLGVNLHGGVGYMLTPLHMLELGASYGRLKGNGGHFGADLSYLFDVTAYALQREEPARWQLFAKAGAEATILDSKSGALAGVGALRFQYNVLPTMSLYVEPKLSMYMLSRGAADHSCYSRGNSFASMMMGASFNIGDLIYADRTRIKSLAPLQKWSGTRYSEYQAFIDRLYFTGAAEMGKMIQFTGGNLTESMPLGANAHIGLGIKLSPVHSLEVGAAYGRLQGNGGRYIWDAAYLFDLTSYALCRESAPRWQLFTKVGVENSRFGEGGSSTAGVGGLRLQYNVIPNMGLYAEPKISMYLFPNDEARHSRYGRINTFASVSFGASFNIGGISYADRYRFGTLPDIDQWSGSSFAEPKESHKRFYLNVGGAYGAMWNYNQCNLVGGFPRGSESNVAVGYNLSPVHSLEFGVKYGSLKNTDKHYGLNASYLFDMTSYALCREEPTRVQLLLRSGVEMDLLEDATAAAAVGAIRLQYNVLPQLGIYAEPRVGMYLTRSRATSQYYGRGDVLTMLSVGLSTRF